MLYPACHYARRSHMPDNQAAGSQAQSLGTPEHTSVGHGNPSPIDISVARQAVRIMLNTNMAIADNQSIAIDLARPHGISRLITAQMKLVYLFCGADVPKTISAVLQAIGCYTSFWVWTAHQRQHPALGRRLQAGMLIELPGTPHAHQASHDEPPRPKERRHWTR